MRSQRSAAMCCGGTEWGYRPKGVAGSLRSDLICKASGGWPVCRVIGSGPALSKRPTYALPGETPDSQSLRTAADLCGIICVARNGSGRPIPAASAHSCGRPQSDATPDCPSQNPRHRRHHRAYVRSARLQSRCHHIQPGLTVAGDKWFDTDKGDGFIGRMRAAQMHSCISPRWNGPASGHCRMARRSPLRPKQGVAARSAPSIWSCAD